MRRPCIEPGCPEVTTASRCTRCEREYERARGTAAQRGYGARHRRWREDGLKLEPRCRSCGAPSVVADHIVALSEGGTWSPANRAMLCVSCHNRKTAIRRHEREQEREGMAGSESFRPPPPKTEAKSHFFQYASPRDLPQDFFFA